jgi:hypothetical protein
MKTPFDEEDQEEVRYPSKDGLKNVGSQKSIFDHIPLKPKQADLDQKVKEIQERETGYKMRAAELAVDFNKIIKDKTLRINKNVIQRDIEKDLIDRMINFAFEVNQDRLELDGSGSVSLILLLLKTTLFQRDQINELEYNQVRLQKALDVLSAKTEGLDKPKSNE